VVHHHHQCRPDAAGIAPNAVPLVIGWLLGPAAAGLFSLAQKASVVILQPSQMLGQASFSIMSQLLTKGYIDEFRHTVLRSSAVATGLALVAAVADRPVWRQAASPCWAARVLSVARR